MERIRITEALTRAIEMAVTHLPEDVISALERARSMETSEIAITQLDVMLDNVSKARNLRRPICQDTGLVSFYLMAGIDFPHLSTVVGCLEDALLNATRNAYLRPNTVDPFTNRNTGDNTGPYMPVVDVWFVDGSDLTLHILPKGGGSENASALWMLSPYQGLDTAREKIIERVAKVGARACPPLILGIGIGGTADFAMKLAKRALLRPVGSRHQEDNVATLETDLLEEINALGIGPMGLGGKTTALDVHVEYTYRHPATYAVALAVQCWADRRAKVVFDRDMNIIAGDIP